MLMDAYGREGGVKNPKNHAYVIYGYPHRSRFPSKFPSLKNVQVRKTLKFNKVCGTIIRKTKALTF